MAQTIRIFQVDAFTSQRFTGNPAGVVLDADGLADADMQAIARELNNGDTAFVLQPDAADHDLRVRFFTPRREAAFVGHATLALHAVLAELGAGARPRQKQSAGIVHVDTLQGSHPPRIAIHQAPPPLLGPPEAAALAAVLEALSLSPADLDPRCPPWVAGSNSTRLLLGIRDGKTLARLQPDLARLTQLSAQHGVPGYFVFSLQPSVPAVYTEARMFCPALGFAEDPVSGNAHALLGHYLLQRQLLGGAATETERGAQAVAPGTAAADAVIHFTGAQGHHLGRPGRVTTALSLQAGVLQSVSIIGEAVIVFGTTLTL